MIIYLNYFYEKLILLFSKKLKKLHNINEDKKYWEIILSPWLFTMIPFIFDRWEVIKNFYRPKSKCKIPDNY